MNFKIALITLGCPKNLVDSENMIGLFEDSQFNETKIIEEADIIIVNTCGFILSAKEESIENILEASQYKKTGRCKYLIVAGCLSERYYNDLFNDIPEVDAIIGSHAWSDIVNVLNRVLKNERFIYIPDKFPVQYNYKLRTKKYTDHTAYLKIAEGCDNACSYCIIPYIRGPYTSRAINDILEEAKLLAKQGVKELVLVAQDVTRYGEDLTGQLLLPRLLSELVKIEGLKFIRILYAYPRYITEELIDTMAKYDKICKYIDIPLQHINDDVLNRMNRQDKKNNIIKLLDTLRFKIPNICIRTTFIVGFPGETEEEYNELKNFIIQEKFDKMGIFMYSQEEGTFAATLEQVPDIIKEERYHELMSIQAKISEEKNVESEHQIIEVLVDEIKHDEVPVAICRSYKEAPEIDGNIYIEDASNLKKGDIVLAKIVKGFSYDLIAEKTDNNEDCNESRDN